MDSYFWLQQMPTKELYNPNLILHFFEEGTFFFSHSGTTLVCQEEKNCLHIKDVEKGSTYHLFAWTNDPKRRLRIITGESDAPNYWTTSMLVKMFNLENEFKKIETILSKEELAHTDMTESMLAFAFPFPVIPPQFKDVYEDLDELGKQSVDRLEYQSCHSLAFRFQKAFEQLMRYSTPKRNFWIPYTEIPFQDHRFFRLRFEPCTFEFARDFRNMLEQKKDEMEAVHTSFQSIYLQKNLLIHLVNEYCHLPSERKKAVLSILHSVHTPFDPPKEQI